MPEKISDFAVLHLSGPRFIVLAMFDEELPKPKTSEFPRNLGNMSVSELEYYIAELKEEIGKVEGDMAKKKASADAADSVFKS